MARRSQPPSPMEDDDSRVEAKPSGARPEVRRQIGKLDDEDSVSKAVPAPTAKGRRAPPGAVGLRSAPASKRKEVSEKVVEARGESRRRVREARDEHRQRVWDKLDEARRRADEKRPRIDKFRPLRGDE